MKNKYMTILCMSSAILLGACSSSPKKQASPTPGGDIYMLVGSYSTPEEEGIKVYQFNEETGEVVYLSGLKGISNPSYLTPSADGQRIYAVGEDAGDTSTAHTLRFDPTKGELTLLNSQLTDGGAPCYIALSPSERFVTTANYMGGNITIFPLDKERKLRADKQVIQFTGSSSDKERQTQPHLHCTIFTPDGKFLLANDLGTDRIHTFPIDESASTLIDEATLHDVEVAPGSGPRHISFHPNGKFAYLINEISGKVIAFSYQEGKLETLQAIEADTVNAQGSADIHLSPDGKFLYASNRLKADGIAIFAVNETNGILTKAGYQLTGIHPRNFIITPNGRYLLVACRDSNVIQIFERDADSGLLKDTGKVIETPKPVCLKFIPITVTL